MARVLLFGPLRDLAGWRERRIEAGSVEALLAAITAEDPQLGAGLVGPGVQVAVDQQVVRIDVALLADSEVAFLPPMSGG
jgi:sulfur-carrier protein